jgi:dipeptidase D
MMRTSIRLTLTLATALLAGSALLACGSDDEFTDADAEQAMLATFEEINRVPRCSKDETRISAWLVDWARARGFTVTTDAQDNVLITVPATAGWETRPGVVLQAHMDMVCLKTETSTHDFTKDPIPVIRDGDWVHAKDTTLGADDGIGIAIALTIAEKATKPHPKLEILITTDEEKDMTGAAGVSATALTGKRYINLDSEDDTVVTLGAAGGVHTDVESPMALPALSPDQQVFVLKVSGLLGGHSGMDIDKNRANANVLVAQLLAESVPFRLVGMSGGSADNAITTSAEATLAVAADDVEGLQKRVTDFTASARVQYPEETGMAITLAPAANVLQLAASLADSATAMTLITAIPQGVTEWSTEFADLPETSNNIGIVNTTGSAIQIATFQRSFHEDNLHAIAGQIAATSQDAGASSSQRGEFPAWPPNSNSGLYRAVIDAYSKLFGSEMTTSVIHAGLECGYIAEKYPPMEIVSIGPTLENVHTTNERLKVASLRKMWNLVQEVLQAP